MSTGAYQPSDATRSYRRRHRGFCWCFEFDYDTRHVPSLAKVFEGPIYNHRFKVYFTKKTHFAEYFKMTEKLSIPRNLVTERKYPYDQIPLSTDARLLRVAEPRLSVNRMISGTRTYARTLLNGSHSMLPYSFTRTMVPMVYLCRVTLDNWTVYCYDSIIRQHNSTDHNADLYLRYCVGKATSNYWEMVREERERDRLEKEKMQIVIQKK